MKRVAETFRAISLVKFNAWESRMANRIGTAHDAEVASIRQYFRLDIARTVLTAGMPIFISVVAFAVYAGLLGHALTPAPSRAPLQDQQGPSSSLEQYRQSTMAASQMPPRTRAGRPQPQHRALRPGARRRHFLVVSISAHDARNVNVRILPYDCSAFSFFNSSLLVKTSQSHLEQTAS
jgi:hypothetical protein